MEARTLNGQKRRRLIVGISGASGAIYGVRLLEALRALGTIETHLVLTKAGERTVAEETDYRSQDIKALASFSHPVADIGASIASGSFRTMGMVIVPCSIRTAAAIAHCISDNLVTRAADVVLKERRKLLVRETPLHGGHLRMLAQAADSGAIIMPPVPAFYSSPATIEDVVRHTVGRVLDQFDIEHDLLVRWREPVSAQRLHKSDASSISP